MLITTNKQGIFFKSELKTFNEICHGTDWLMAEQLLRHSLMGGTLFQCEGKVGAGGWKHVANSNAACVVEHSAQAISTGSLKQGQLVVWLAASRAQLNSMSET